MNKFQEAKIYVIKSPSFDKVYIGSTTQPLNIRFSEHKSHYKRYLAGKRNYTSSYALIKLDDAYIELLQDCKCDTKQELLAFIYLFINHAPTQPSKKKPNQRVDNKHN